ncbi:hypothetical protein GLAREA_00073 [Glarea lozoyensis ATCC 20868]|uniref:2EXR domain-containing protein n=1 Tax=Glarea lozoyensis (strain ATCC 20868 / MF5171) TaxID=1116229 RepID=S3CTD6_GLAL2|nr:uncharacterized protein GLAREA_00073 [Glarea lozoyensis ATCC 20868]EPE28915.1 hypothetical protein GLAREA_00073 [Glarea lozoyensis ATCC 20868]
MLNTQLSDLPRGLREEIWSLGLLPQPGVYKFDPEWFVFTPDGDGWEDERWMIPKRKYPSVMNVCQESRYCTLRIKSQEQKREQENGNAPYYCVGESARPFNPAIDTFWFSKEALLRHHWVSDLSCVIGNRLHIIENLAISQECFTPTVLAPRLNVQSVWNSFRWCRLLRFMSLRRVDVILAVGRTDEHHDETLTGKSPSSRGKELRIEKWTAGSSMETPQEVDTLIENVRASTVEAFQDLYENMLVGNAEEERLLPFPDGFIANWHDGSRINFHASMVQETSF